MDLAQESCPRGSDVGVAGEKYEVAMWTVVAPSWC